MKEKIYYVNIAVDGRVSVQVKASSPEEAEDLALDAFLDVELGELEVVDCSVVNAEDEDGNLIDF